MGKFMKFLGKDKSIRYPLIALSSLVPIGGDTDYFGRPVIPFRRNSHKYSYQQLEGLYGSQGFAMYENYAVRVNTGNSSGTTKGSLSLYDISDLSNIKTIFSNKQLDSGGYANHCNSCQFANEKEPGHDFPLLYVSGNYKSTCFVYRITTSSVTLVQTIFWDTESDLPELNGMHPNIQIGDDGYLWAVSDNCISGGSGDKDYVYKLNAPSVSNSSVVLSKNDVVDSFSIARWKNFDQTWQGTKIYNGKVYFLRGSTNKNTSGIEVIDVEEKKLVSAIPLSMSNSEPEDLEIYNNRLFMAYGSTNSFVLLDF